MKETADGAELDGIDAQNYVREKKRDYTNGKFTKNRPNKVGVLEEEPDEEDSPNWASKDGFYVHQLANAVGELRGDIPLDKKEFDSKMLKIKALNDGTTYADQDRFQTGANSFRHAMRDKYESVEMAKKNADMFVRGQFAVAKQLLAAGLTYEAYKQFGIGLHVLQDATSPSHAGFQPWSDKPGIIRGGSHVVKELIYPGVLSNLQKVTNQYIDWFEHSSSALPRENLFNNIKSD